MTIADIAASSLALNTINAEWPAIKESLFIKKDIDNIFKISAEHREKAAAAEDDYNNFRQKAQGVLGLLILNKSKKENEFLQRIKAEHDAASDSDLMLQKMAEKFQRIKHKYDILEDNMAILLRDYRKVSAGVDSIQATFITLSKSRSAYDEAKINLPKFVHARSLLKNARLDGERMRVKLIDEYSGDGFEKNSLPNDMLTGSESFVDPNTQKDAIQTADTIEKKILKAFELVPTLPPRVIRTDTMDPNGAAAFSRRRNAIVIQNAVHRLDDTMDNIDTWIAFLEPKIVSYRAQEVTQERVVCDAAKEVWRGVVGRMQGETVGEVGDWIEELGLNLRAFLEC